MAVRPRRPVAAALHRERRRLRFERLEDRRLLSLSHLYTFNDGLANDWIGSAHGTVFNGATIAGGQLVLANNGVTSGQSGVVQYARLGANVLPNSGDATIEIWFTVGNIQPGARVLDIGTQLAGVGDTYLSLLPNGTDDSRALLHPTGTAERIASGPEVDDGLERMAAIVIDSSAGFFRLYLDGTEVGSTPLDGASAGSINDLLAYLGRSIFNADLGFTGSINEVRVYDNAQSASEVAADAAAGPSTLTKSPLVRQMEYLDRGMVVVRRGASEAYVGWRLLGTDPAGIAFNLYRSAGGAAAVKLNASPITASTNYVDSTANFSVSNAYFVRAVIGGVEQVDSRGFTLSANAPVQQYLNVPLQIPAGGTTPAAENYTYSANDASVGDLDGDGRYEIILKWDPSNAKDNSQSGYTGNVYVDAYTLDGTLLWRIDLGRNIRAGAHYTQLSVYDLDGDGKAEVVLKTAPGTIDGKGNKIFLGTDNPDADYRNSSGYILTGPEYLTVFNGGTGKAITTVPYQPARGSVTQWGDSYGNRVDRFTSGIAYLDGVHPSVIVGRGYYGPQSSGGQSRNEVAAYDFRDGQLTLRWTFKAGLNINGNINSNYIGQGAHSLTIGDVDGDGKDEIIYGAAAINDNGLGLYTTGLGHGDALHISDMDPNRPGLEVFMPHEGTGGNGHIGASLRDARTGVSIVALPVTQNTDGTWPDVGRGIALDIDPNHAGYEFWDSYHGSIYNAQGVAIYNKPSNMHTNFGVWWDADLLRETLDGTTIGDWNYTTAGRQNFNLANSSRSSNNGSKSTPALSADLFGDWREEVIWRRSDNTALQIWTTTITATNRLYTLMHDSQYRESIAAQNSAYNQPPHPSFFLGAGMPPPPVPQIFTVQAPPKPPGDYNGDTVVDTADYAVWRDTLGSTTNLRADGDGDKIIGLGDYDVWKLHLGMHAGSGSIVVSNLGGGSASTLGPETTNSFSTGSLSSGGASVEQQFGLLEFSPTNLSSASTSPSLTTSGAPASPPRGPATRTTDLLFALLDAEAEISQPSTPPSRDSTVKPTDDSSASPLDFWAEIDSKLPWLRGERSGSDQRLLIN